MAKKNYEFRPDKTGSGLLSRLYLTRLQRLSILKWTLYSLLQDVLLCRMSIFGATTDLVPCGIFIICLLEGVEHGSLFTLIGALVYLFSGSSPGYHVLVLLPFLGVGAGLFRESLLRKSFSSTFLCVSVSTTVYELVIFAMALFLKQTHAGRFQVALITTGLTLAAIPILYPILVSISKIGGETWKD